MTAGWIALLVGGGGVLVAALLVGGIAIARGALSGLAPSRRPDSELGRAREEIQQQIDAGRRGYRL